MEGEQPYLGDLLTTVINHLLTGMILQVGGDFLHVGGVSEAPWLGPPTAAAKSAMSNRSCNGRICGGNRGGGRLPNGPLLRING